MSSEGSDSELKSIMVVLANVCNSDVDLSDAIVDDDLGSSPSLLPSSRRSQSRTKVPMKKLRKSKMVRLETHRDDSFFRRQVDQTGSTEELTTRIFLSYLLHSDGLTMETQKPVSFVTTAYKRILRPPLLSSGQPFS